MSYAAGVDVVSTQTKAIVVDEDGSTSKDFNDNFGTFPWAAASPFGYNGRFFYTRASIRLTW